MAGTIDDGGLSVPVNPTLKKLDYVTEFNGFIKQTAVTPGVKVGANGNLIAPQSSNQFAAEPIRAECDAMRINGIWTPGFCVISNAGIPIKWDKRSGYGFSGATCVYTGNDLVEFDAEFTIITQTQMNAWKAFEKKFIGVMESNATSVAAQNARAAAALSEQVQALTAQAQSVAQNPGKNCKLKRHFKTRPIFAIKRVVERANSWCVLRFRKRSTSTIRFFRSSA
jgi:hypothetical protein